MVAYLPAANMGPPVLLLAYCLLGAARGQLIGARRGGPPPPPSSSRTDWSAAHIDSPQPQSPVDHHHHVPNGEPPQPVGRAGPEPAGRAGHHTVDAHLEVDGPQADAYRGGGGGGGGGGSRSRSGRRPGWTGRRGRSGGRRDDSYVANCSVCAVREINRLHRLESIKKDILRKLRMKAPPNITKDEIRRISRPLRPLLTDVFYPTNPHPNQGQQYDDDGRARTQQVISFATPPPSDVLERMPGSDRFVHNYFYFPLDQDDVRHSEILNARLSVFVQRVQTPHHSPTQILVYAGSLRHGHFRWQYLASDTVPLNYEGTNIWYHFNVTTNVRQWINSPSRNLGLKVLVQDQFGNPLAVIESNPSNETDYRPRMTLALRPRPPSRARRAVDFQCDLGDFNYRYCCRYPLEVDFSEIGWDWIIAPSNFVANFCSGECPYAHLPQFPHTTVTQLQQAGRMAGPCCAPSQLRSTDIVYFNENLNIVFGSVPDMIVETCGCS